MTAMSSSGTISGTPAYMSPEQARGDQTGRETDIWAFGVVLYEMLTGLSPFARDSSAETLAQVLNADVDESRLPATTPDTVRRLLRRCLEKDPRRRWRHVGDARITLEDLGSDRAEPAAMPVAPMSRRRVMLYGAAAAALLASGAGAAVVLGGRQPPTVVPTFRRLTFRRGVIRSARFTPDGQTVLYGALWEGNRCQVQMVRVDGPESQPLDHLPNANLLAVSRSGEIAATLGSHESGIFTYGTLARVPMAGGAPREEVEDVKFADWSPDGADLAIVRRVDGRDRLEYPIGTTLVAPDVGDRTGIGFPRISPDGTRVAFVSYLGPQSLIGRVSIVDRSGAVVTLSEDFVNIHGLAWRGDEILYTAADDRPLFRALRAVTAAGTARVISRVPGNLTLWDALPDGRLVTAETDDHGLTIARSSGGSVERDLSWLDATWLADLSRDGRLMLFSEYGQGGGPGSSIYMRSTDGGPAVRLGPGVALALSPDGLWAIGLPGPAASSYLNLIPTGAGEARRLQGGTLLFSGARWLPDGRRILVTAAEAGRPTRLHVFDVGTGEHRSITSEGVDDAVVSPDGSMVAARGPGSVIRIHGIDDTSSRDVPGSESSEVLVGWIVSGLLVMRPDDPESPLGEIYRIDVRTGRKERWNNVLPKDRAGVMGHMSFRATPDGQSFAFTWHRSLSSLYLCDGLG
jgi:hypothetical protein